MLGRVGGEFVNGHAQHHGRLGFQVHLWPVKPDAPRRRRVGSQFRLEDRLECGTLPVRLIHWVRESASSRSWKRSCATCGGTPGRAACQARDCTVASVFFTR